MIKAKVKIVGWPAFGAEALKPRFQIRGEYDLIDIQGGLAAILDDHNQIAYMGLDLLEFVEVQGQRLLSLDDFLKKNPGKSPEAQKKMVEEEQRKAANQEDVA